MTTTNNTIEPVMSSIEQTVESLLTFAGANTFVPGTLLARDSSTGKLVIYVKGGSTNGNGVASHVLIGSDSVRTGSGDNNVTAATIGKVRFSRLVIDADGDNSNVDENVILQLAQNGIVVEKDRDLSELDNQ